MHQLPLMHEWRSLHQLPLMHGWRSMHQLPLVHEWRSTQVLPHPRAQGSNLAEPRRAGDFLRDILKQAVQSKSRSAYAEALDQILAERLRPHCQIVGCRAGKLTLEVDSAPLFAELSGFRREEIRLRINQLVPDQPIAQLQFRLGGTGHV